MESNFKAAILTIIFCFCLLLQRCYSACSSALGMEDGRIKDGQITALNWLYFDQDFNLYYRPSFARLNNKKLGGGGWCSASIAIHRGAYIEIDLLKDTKITAVASQGRGIGNEFIDEFGITYRRDNDTSYRDYKERGRWHIFTANSDTGSIVKNQLTNPIIARRVRIVPQGDTFSIYCGRFEIYGCEWKKQQDRLVSYLLPLANKFGEFQTTDHVYDGETDTQLEFKAGGLGKLVDDEYGDATIGNKWVAFKKRQKFMPFFQFDFGIKRRFNAIKFHMINKGSNIQVFSQVKIQFSEDGRIFGKEQIYLTTAAERHSSSAFVITVSIPEIVAKVVKCIFTQSAEWMMFSEIEFSAVSPDAPLPTRPAPLTKKATTLATTEAVVIETVPPATTAKPTPRLLFSLPDEITDVGIIDGHFTTTKTPRVVEVLPSKKEVESGPVSPTTDSKPSTGSLSFPIIIAIVLGAVVVSAITAVLIVRQIRKMGKDGDRPVSQQEKMLRPPVQSPEFHELLISDRHIPPAVLLKGKMMNEPSAKLIMDSGYTSHGSAGGSVKEMPVRGNAGSPV
ncbi:discoidin domain-containing receptor tyrosine kinase B-like isoform X2 [Rhopilema esculentum]